MSECKKALRHFFKSCKVCLYRRVEGLQSYFLARPFRQKSKWKFSEGAVVHGSAILSDDGREMWHEDFKGGPFVIPPAGGQIEVSYQEITLGPYTVKELFPKARKRRLRGISEARAARITEAFSKYGKVNGCGIQVNDDGDYAIAVYFEEADRLEDAPKQFESWPVVPCTIGKITVG